MARKSARRSMKRASTRQPKRHSKRRSTKRPSKWIKALKRAGFLRKGSFNPIPKTGSIEYKRVKAIMNKL